MGIEKGLLIQSIAQEFGATFDDLKESAEADAIRCEAIASAFGKAAAAIHKDLASHVDADLDAERYSLETAAVAKRYIDRAAYSLREFGDKARLEHLAARGRSEGLSNAVAVVKKRYDAETAKAEAIVRAIEAPAPEAPKRAPGVRPESLKATRRREAEAARGPAKAPSKAKARKPRKKANAKRG